MLLLFCTVGAALPYFPRSGISLSTKRLIATLVSAVGASCLLIVGYYLLAD